MGTIEYRVSGMTCKSCVNAVQGAAKTVGGVEKVIVDLKGGRATVEVKRKTKRIREEIRQAIEDSGFDVKIVSSEEKAKEVEQQEQEKKQLSEKPDAEIKKVVLEIEGMTCNSCVKSIKSCLRGVNGVIDAKISLEKNEGVITFDEAQVEVDVIEEAIRDCGFEVKVKEEDEDEEAEELLFEWIFSTVEKLERDEAKIVEKGLKAIEGVERVKIRGREIRVKYDGGKAKVEDIIEVMGELGIGIEEKRQSSSTENRTEYEKLVSEFEKDSTLVPMGGGQESTIGVMGSSGRVGEDGVTRKAFFTVKGMTCSSCVRGIETGLYKLSYVKEAMVNLLAQQAKVVYCDESEKTQEIITTIEDLGFEAALVSEEVVEKKIPGVSNDEYSVNRYSQAELQVHGMGEEDEGKKIEAELMKLDGIQSAKVKYGSNSAIVRVITENRRNSDVEEESDTVIVVGSTSDDISKGVSAYTRNQDSDNDGSNDGASDWSIYTGNTYDDIDVYGGNSVLQAIL